jgi:indolepyruvate ferredoxin oxidoreductase, alpha subunit
MSGLLDQREGKAYLLMGNEAIVRGALEAGISVASGYPGTPSSEIIENLARIAGEAKLYVEWSVNEKVASEVAAAASFAGLRSLCAMKQNGVNVASDFLLHLGESGTRGGMVLVFCDDPGALSSVNEGESRYFAKLLEIPLLEPGDFQEAKDMTKWAFTLSEEIKNLVLLRSVTRLSHASGNVVVGKLPKQHRRAQFNHEGAMFDPVGGPVISMPPGSPLPNHDIQQRKMRQAEEIFETSPFNTYTGPKKPDLLIVTSSASNLYCREAIHLLGLGKKVGLLKIGTTWPLPARFLKRHLAKADNILIVEEVLPFLEENVKVAAVEAVQEIGPKKFFGRRSGTLPPNGELNPDIVAAAIAHIMKRTYQPMNSAFAEKALRLSEAAAPRRELTFCPGCPHRASFWSIHNALELDGRHGFVCGDIGCYSLAMFPCGFNVLRTLHSMGTGAGIANGFSQLQSFGLDQPVVAVCGDSTFFHSGLPPLVNAVHHRAPFTMIVLDNSGTAMTGFQPHPGLTVNALNEAVPAVPIEQVAKAIGARVEICDPFDIEATQSTILNLLEKRDGTSVLILRQLCALSPEKKWKKKFEVTIDEKICLGENCGCNHFCTRIFRCPGLSWDADAGSARIDEVICAGCGVCAHICPSGAITKRESK